MVWILWGLAFGKPLVLNAGSTASDVRAALGNVGRTVDVEDVQGFDDFARNLPVQFDGGDARGCYGASMPTAAVLAAIEVLQSPAARTSPEAFVDLLQRTEADLACMDRAAPVGAFFFAKARHGTAMGAADTALQAFRDARSTGFEVSRAPADVAEQLAGAVLPEGTAMVRIEPYPDRVWVDGVLATHGPLGVELPLGRHLLTVQGTRITGADLMVERSGTLMLPAIYDRKIVDELGVSYRARALQELAAMARATLFVSDGVNVYKATGKSVEDLVAPTKDLPPPTRRPGDDTVCLAGGVFFMGESGSDRRSGPRHQALVGPFCVQDHPVTQADYLALMGQSPSTHRDCPTCPVEHVSWAAATEYANALSVVQGLTKAYGADGELIPGTSGWRLPTEAQWEFAARGGEPHRFAGSNDAKAVAWTQEEAKHPMPVCTKARNGFDLCDMSGNVGEWVADWSASYGDSGIQVEPLGPADGDLKVVRGGGFNQSSAMATVSHRGAMTPTAADRAIGFRLVRP